MTLTDEQLRGWRDGPCDPHIRALIEEVRERRRVFKGFEAQTLRIRNAALDEAADVCRGVSIFWEDAPAKCREAILARKTPEREDGYGNVGDIADEILLSRAIQSLARKRGRVKQPLWVSAMDTFALGSTYAQQLCRRFGHDPDTIVRR